MSENKQRFDPQSYVSVSERIEKFYAKHQEGRINTMIVEHDAERGFILIRTEVYRNQEDTLPAATGHAYEYKSEGYVNRTSYIENCESSSIGRALAIAGFEVKRGIASSEEMRKVQRHEQDGNAGYDQSKPQKPSSPIAKNMSELITPSQLNAIRRIATTKQINGDAECEKEFNCKVEELSKEAASFLIKHLQEIG